MTRILIIEDNATNLTLMTYLVDKFGYSSLTAMNGEDGLDVATREVPDLIICDLHMPKVNGWEFADRIKGDPTLKSIPLIAVTAFAMVGDRERVLAAGFDGYIAKPIEPETFVASVEAFLPAELRAVRSTEPRPVEAAKPTTIVHDKNGATVLVVDDLAANRDLIRYILDGAGYTVVIASSVAEGLIAAARVVPDAVITDTHMMPRSGFDLIKSMKADPYLKSVPIILTSASGNYGASEASGLEHGAANFLAHPIKSEVLLPMISACLNKEPQS